MKTFLLLISITLLLLSSCGGEEVMKNRLIIPEKGFEFTLDQRKSIVVPSTVDSTVFCHIGDITMGRTRVKIYSAIDDSIYEQQIIRLGGKIPFEYASEKYVLECVDLVNKLVGMDYGKFRIRSNSPVNTSNGRAQINALLRKIETSDITFIRNGEEHSGKDAAEHLRSKLEQADGKIKTLDDFIKHIASHSSMSGKPYFVKLKNGKVMEAKDWYRMK